MSTREHRALRRGVEAYLDGEADPSLAVSVRRHLAVCWECSEDAEWLVLIKSALGRIGEHRPRDLTVARLSRYAIGLLERWQAPSRSLVINAHPTTGDGVSRAETPDP